MSLNKRETKAGEAEKDDVHGGRCPCGHLLFVKVKGGIEIKCRHCKRVHLIKL